MTCPHCRRSISDKLIRSHAARLAGKRSGGKRPGAGRPKKLARCASCGRDFGVVEMQAHDCATTKRQGNVT